MRHDPRRWVSYARLTGATPHRCRASSLLCPFTMSVQPTVLTSTCPECQATVSDDDLECAACGTAFRSALAPENTPLILPGSPAFSADTVRGRGSPGRLIGAVLVGVTSIAGVTLLMLTREPPPREGQPEPEIMAYSTYYTVAESAAAHSRGARARDASERAERERVTSLANGDDAAMPVAVAPLTDAGVAPLTAVVTPPPSVPAATLDRRTSIAVAPSAPSIAPASIAPRSIAPPSVPSTVTPSRTPAPAPVSTPVVAAPTRSRVASTPTRVPPPARPSAPAAPVPVLRLVGLPSETLVPGGMMSLRWTIRDQRTGRAMSVPIAFTSTDARIATVNSRTGTVTARAPGRVRIIADGGVAGEASVALTIRAPELPTAILNTVPTERLIARTPPAITSPTPTGAGSAAAMTRPATSANAPASPAPSPVRNERVERNERSVGSGDIRAAVERYVSLVRSGNVRDFQLTQFLADGEDHRVTLSGSPNTLSSSGAAVRVAFDIRLSKYDAAGRPVTRVAPIAMDVEQTASGVSASAIAVGTLRRP